MIVRPVCESDRQAIAELHHQAFGGPAEADLVEALHAGGYVVVSRVAERNGQVVGHILFSRLTILAEPGPLDALALAPLAVLPGLQRQGIGSRLVEEGLRACAAQGERIVVVLGHPEYYPRFGFRAALAEPLRSPFSGPAWMALELVPGALAGVRGAVRYPPPFQVASH